MNVALSHERLSVNGEKMQLRPCERIGEDGHPTQIYVAPPSPDNYYTMPLSIFFPTPNGYRHKCIDLTGGSTANGNVLQIWECNPDVKKPWKNQIWKTTIVN